MTDTQRDRLDPRAERARSRHRIVADQEEGGVGAVMYLAISSVQRRAARQWMDIAQAKYIGGECCAGLHLLPHALQVGVYPAGAKIGRRSKPDIGIVRIGGLFRQEV